MSISITSTAVQTATVGSLYSYTLSAVETVLPSVSAIHHWTLSAGTSVGDATRPSLVSATDGSAVLTWYPKVSDVVAGPAQSVALTVTAYNLSGGYANQALSISADYSATYKKRTNIGDGSGTLPSNIADFSLRGGTSRT